jgi:hypothetical protein
VSNIARVIAAYLNLSGLGREITMPKKAASTRHRAQRNKPKVQKNFELVRPERVEAEAEESSTTPAKVAVAAQEESGTSGGATDGQGRQAPSLREESRTSGRTSTADEQGQAPRGEPEAKTEGRQKTPAPGSASARLEARRQAAQKLQQRSAATLITSEHFAYVRKDLIKIAVFAALMFTAIIVLYFTLGRA